MKLILMASTELSVVKLEIQLKETLAKYKPTATMIWKL